MCYGLELEAAKLWNFLETRIKLERLQFYYEPKSLMKFTRNAERFMILSGDTKAK